MLSEPALDFTPLQSPVAVHVDALVLLQVSVVDPPLSTALGTALKVTVGAGVDTVMVVLWLAVPPAPVHAKVYVPLLVRLVRLNVPEVALAPLHAPDAAHDVTFVLVQLSVLSLPLFTTAGVALIETVGIGVGGGCTVTSAELLALPPSPVQVSVYVAFAVSTAVLCVPVSATAPDHAPDATQAVAAVLDQLNVDVPL